MSKLRMAAGAACCLVALVSGQAAASGDAQCWQSYEVEAARVHDLHVMLMLGSLKCRAANSEIPGKYEAFFEKQHGSLNSYNNILKARFMRVNGIADGQRVYEEFTTRLGNSYSNSAQMSSLCQMTDTLLTLATNAGDKELPLLARNFSETPVGVGDICEAPATVAVANAVAPQAAVAAPAPAADVTAADPPTPQSAAAALEAAALALQTAAASLKTAPAPQPAEKTEVAPATAQPVSAVMSTPAS